MKNTFLKTITLIAITIAVIFLSKKIIANKEKTEEKVTSNMVITNSTDTTSSNSQNNSKVDTSLFEKAYVKRVVDGDTIVVTINDEDYKVRLIGIDTPESTTEIEPYGKEASSYTTSKLTGTTIYLEKDVSETDKYGRLLRYVWIDIPNEISENEMKDKLFNANLLLNGYASIFTYPPDVKYSDYFKNFESVARENNLGLWGL